MKNPSERLLSSIRPMALAMAVVLATPGLVWAAGGEVQAGDATAPSSKMGGVKSGFDQVTGHKSPGTANANTPTDAAPAPAPSVRPPLTNIEEEARRNFLADKYRAEGIKAYKAEKYDEAIQAFRQSQAILPGSLVTTGWLQAAINSKELARRAKVEAEKAAMEAEKAAAIKEGSVQR